MAAAAAIAAALSKINTCQANEACKSALSMIPQEQGMRLTETMESVKNHLQRLQPAAAAGGSEVDEQWIATMALRVEELMDKYLYHSIPYHPLEVDCDHLAQLGQVARSMAEIEVDVKLLVSLRGLAAAAAAQSQGTGRQYDLLPILLKLVYVVVIIILQAFFSVLWMRLKMAWRAADTDNADLINFLTNRYLTDFFSLEQSQKVLCIVGPSRRETDQANATASGLYNDTHQDFNCSVSVELPKGRADPAKILADILHIIDESGDHNGHDPIDEVKKALSPKRYIILIKNLRDADTWKAIKGAFPDNNSSRVMITTCRLDVAEECFSGESELIYTVRPKPTTGERSGEDHTSVDTLLSQCPEDLKGCSLYLSTVPDSHVFERASMVMKWVSEGLVPEEKIGHEHFGELLCRDVIQPKRQYYSKFRAEPTYVVNHRLLSGLREKSQAHNVAIHIDTGSAEEALCRLADPENKKIPRLSLNCRFASSRPVPEAAAETRKKKKKKTPAAAAAAAAEQRWDHHLAHARSMTVRGHGTRGLVKDLVGANLCVLDLEGCEDLDNSDVVDICRRLILLKYLSINGTPVSEIPPDIKNLKDLETLDVRETKVTVLPREIDELPGLVHLLVSDWLEMTQRYPRKDEPAYSWRNANHLLGTVAVLDIRICQLEKNDLERLGCMSDLRSLALTLAGLPKEEMVITRGHLFKKLQVLALDCHVPWITFTEGAMPELRRLYLTLYAGPQGKTPSGTNHLKKLHEVTLRYSKQYKESVCVKETTRTMQEEGCMRSRPTTFVVDDKVTIPKIQVPNYSKQTSGWLVRKFVRYFFDNIFSLLLPPVSALRPHLARMTNRQLLVMIPLLALLFYYDIALWIRMTPLVLDVARRALHCAALFLVCSMSCNTKCTFIVFLPILAYHVFCIFILAYWVLSPVIQPVCTTLFGLACALLRLGLVYILRPLWYTLATVFSLVAPVIFVFVLSRRLPRMPGVQLLFFLRSLALLLYFFPKLCYSSISAIFQLVCNIFKWLVWGA